jgi:hypothetical protein
VFLRSVSKTHTCARQTLTSVGLTWQMQRNLGAAIDLSQAWIFTWSWIQRKCFSPTPRELIELSAPQPFPYADYYNNYLFVSTVGLCMGTLQPIILPITAFYLAMDCIFKKYLLQYVFITKTESGGRFWKLLVNRMLFAVLLANAVIALVVGARGVSSINSIENGDMLSSGTARGLTTTSYCTTPQYPTPTSKVRSIPIIPSPRGTRRLRQGTGILHSTRSSSLLWCMRSPNTFSRKSTTIA